MNEATRRPGKSGGVMMGLLMGVLAANCTLGQSINLDFGAAYLAPTSDYGAAANQFGFWNKWQGNDTTPFPLMDIAGNATTATFVQLDSIGSGAAESGLFFGEDLNLYDDFLTWRGGSSRARFRVKGLTPGHYETFIYALPPDDGTLRTAFAVYDPLFSLPGASVSVGGYWNGYHEEGVSFTRQVQTVFAGRSLGINAYSLNFGTMNAVQLVRHNLSDFDLDGQTTVTDIFAFLNRWFALFGKSWNGMGTSTDINFDRTIDVKDIFAYINLWFAEYNF